MVQDGPDDGPRRSRRTRTDDAPRVNGEVPTGPDDDVLERHGLRDAPTSREDPGHLDADGPAPWPPRSRRRESGPPVSEPGPNGVADGAHRGPNGADGADAGMPDREPPRRVRSGPVPRNGQAADRWANGATRRREPGPEYGARTGADRTDALPPVESQGPRDRPGRRRRGATDSRHTEVMPVTPRRRARDARPEPPVDDPPARPAQPTGSPTAARPAVAPGTGAPTAVPPPPAPPARPAPPGNVPPVPAPVPPGDDHDDDHDAGEQDTPQDGDRRADAPPGNGRRRPKARTAARGDDPPPPTPGPARRLLRIGAVLVAVVVFVACASGFTSRETVENGIRTVAALDPESDAISQRSTQAGDENVLVLGLPADRAGVPEAARGDTAVLVHRPAGGAPAVTIGFPPTLEVARPPCQSWDAASGSYGATVPAESRTAFSAAYDVGGPKCAVDVVQQVTGLAVTRFVAFDLAGVNTLVDSVRGIGVCAERPVVDRALGPVVTRPGDTVLGGSEAERFAAATGVDDASPANRVRRQQRVLSAVLDDALSTTSLLSPGASDRVARALPGALTVDGAEAGDLLVLSRSLSLTTGGGAAPPYVSAPVNELPNTRGHLELNRSDSSNLFSALQKHEPLPPEFTVPAQRAGSPLFPQGTVVDVMNAAGRSGLADEIATALRAQGYAIGAVGDAPPGPDTKIRFSPDRSDASGVLAGSVPGARTEPDPGSTGTLQLVLGSSFPGASAIGAPPQSGPSADCG